MSLSKRILKIIDFVKPCSVVADVGCDHGKIGTELILSEKCKYSIFSDISETCLSKAKKLCFNKKILNRCKFICCDGFNNFKSEIKIDFAIIAGMGGFEISNILTKMPQNIEIDNFILQPNNNVIYLRKALIQNQFKILEDEVIEEQGIFYNVLLVKKGLDSLTKEELEFGRTNLIKYSSEFISYLEFKLNQLEAILQNVKGTEKEEEVVNLIELIKNNLKGKNKNATRNK